MREDEYWNAHADTVWVQKFKRGRVREVLRGGSKGECWCHRLELHTARFHTYRSVLPSPPVVDIPLHTVP